MPEPIHRIKAIASSVSIHRMLQRVFVLLVASVLVYHLCQLYRVWPASDVPSDALLEKNPRKKEEMLKTRLSELSKSHGPLYKEVLSCEGQLAVAFRDQGRTDEALSLQDQHIRKLTQKNGPGDEEVFKARVTRANTLAWAGRNLESIADLEAILQEEKKLWGENDIRLIDAWRMLPRVQKAAKLWAPAEKNYREAIALVEKTHGAQHSDTVILKYNLALCLRDAGKLEDARVVSEQAYRDGLVVHGEGHRLQNCYEALWKELQVAKPQTGK